jgi:hypothetical protein
MPVPRNKQQNSTSEHQWLTPLILDTWEAEMKRTAILGQPQQIVHVIPSPKKKKNQKLKKEVLTRKMVIITNLKRFIKLKLR